MTDKAFLSKGFSEFRPTAFDSNGVEKCFQKRYDDELGKKYFITVRKWSAMLHAYTGVESPPSYEYEVQLYKKGSHDALDLMFHSSWNLEDVEAYVEAMWGTGLFEHYETWDGNRGGE